MNISPLVIATHNEGKAREIRELLTDLAVTVMSAASLGLPEPEETGATFAQNAAIKSESAAKLSGHWALADDSGLCVAALDGEPGIYSARWAGPEKDFTMAARRIQDSLAERGLTADAAAYFICVLSLTSPEGVTHCFEGRVDGKLVFPARGGKGFGYDPVFMPAGSRQTFGEMEPAAKHAISHRAHAFAALKRFLSGAEAA